MIESHDKGTLLFVHVKPRSKKQNITIDDSGKCTVHVKAGPTRGQANAEVLKLVARRLAIPVESVRILSGAKSVKKTLLIKDMSPERVRAVLEQ
jgi:uncharacterized protein (TIGR00251 family)